MSDANPIAVIVAQMQVWVKTMRDDSKEIKRKLENLKKEILLNNNNAVEKVHRQELIISELLSNRSGCLDKFEKITTELKTQSERIPSKEEFNNLKTDRDTQKKEVRLLSNKFIWAAGVFAGVGLFIGLLKFMKYMGVL